MLTINAYAAPSATEPLIPITIERRDLGPHDVLIEIAYAGVCHSDIHVLRGDWASVGVVVDYPQVVGHEIVGTVTEIGAAVTKHAIGDRVGVGCLVNSCGECENCRDGQENYCTNGNVGTYASRDFDGSITQGGYSTHIVVNENFVLRVPEGLPFEAVAPLLCAGVTTYSPLKHWGAGPGKKVAVVGLGGLGHVAVKIAHAMGAEVTVLSQTLSKKDDGLSFGASHYYATNDPETFSELQNTFDMIINTVSSATDINSYLGLLRLDGTLIYVGAPAESMPVNVFALSSGRRSFASSSIGGILETQETLDFCAEHNITAEIEVIAADQINEAYTRLLKSDVRYRFVIDIDTIR